MIKYFKVATAVLVVIFLVWCTANSPPVPEQGPPQEKKGNSAIVGGLKTVPVKVTEVSDGDTIHVTLNGQNETVRLIGVNTPELSHPELNIREQPYGKLAMSFTRKALFNKQVYLELDVGERDRYGRVLAYVWLEQPKDSSKEEVRTKLFNARLLLEGYAQVMSVAPNVKYVEMFKAFEHEARDKTAGLWKKGEKPNDRYQESQQ